MRYAIENRDKTYGVADSGFLWKNVAINEQFDFICKLNNII